jgi:hypothetical protein
MEWVADCKAVPVNKADQKYWYRVPAKRKAKLGPSTVVETILEPGHYAAAYKAYEGAESYAVWFARAIAPSGAEIIPESNSEVMERAAARLKAELDACYAEDRAKVAAEKETERRAAEWKAAQETMARLEPNAETVCGFRFEYRGKRVASTREGLERMGPAILAKVCR